MLERLRRFSATALCGSLQPDATDDGRMMFRSRRELLACMVLNMVERLLVSDGASSEKMLGSRTGSVLVHELIVRLSVTDDAEVPTRDVSNEFWRRVKSGVEKADDAREVSGVRERAPSTSGTGRGAAIKVGVSLLSDDLVSDGARRSSWLSATSNVDCIAAAARGEVSTGLGSSMITSSIKEEVRRSAMMDAVSREPRAP